MTLIAVAAFVLGFGLTSLLAVPHLRRWLSTSAGVPLGEYAEQSLDRLNGQLDPMELTAGRAEWSARLLRRELRKPR